MLVVLAPVLRFLDVGFNADLRIEDIGGPEKLIDGFAPELFGHPVDPANIPRMETVQGDDGLTYYLYEVNNIENQKVYIYIYKYTLVICSRGLWYLMGMSWLLHLLVPPADLTPFPSSLAPAYLTGLLHRRTRIARPRTRTFHLTP